MKEWEPISQDEWKEGFSEEGKRLIFSSKRIFSLSCMFASWLMAFFVAYYLVGMDIFYRMNEIRMSLLLELSSIGQLIQSTIAFPAAVWGCVGLFVGISIVYELKKRLWLLHLISLFVFVALFGGIYHDKLSTLESWTKQTLEQEKYKQGIHLVLTKSQTSDLKIVGLKNATNLWAQNNCSTMWLELQIDQVKKDSSWIFQGQMIVYSSISNLVYQISEEKKTFTISIDQFPSWFDSNKHGHEVILSRLESLLVDLTQQVSPRKLNPELQNIAQMEQAIQKIVYQPRLENSILCLLANQQLLQIRDSKTIRSLGKFDDFLVTNEQETLLLQSYQVAELQKGRPRRLWVSRIAHFSQSPLSLYIIGQKQSGETLLWDLEEKAVIANQTFEPWEKISFTQAANRTYAYKDSALYFWENYLDANTKWQKETLSNSITALEPSVQGAWLGSKQGEILYHENNIELLTTVSGPVTTMKLDHTGRLLMFAYQNQIEVWDVIEKKRQRKYTTSSEVTALNWTMGSSSWCFLVGLANGKVLAGTEVK